MASQRVDAQWADAGERAMRRGYIRGAVVGVGAGAAEWWSALLDEMRSETDLERPVIGEVSDVFERSAYLTLKVDRHDGPPSPGPPLVLLCRESIEGPLSTRVRLPGSSRFRGTDLERNAPCRLHPGIGDADVVLRVDRTLDLTLDPTLLERPVALGPPLTDIRTVTEGDRRWIRGLAALEYLEEAGYEDGLGGFSTIRDGVDGTPLPPAWASLIETWSGMLRERNIEGVDGHWLDLLGRGPGATPSGDDVLAGLLLLLLHGTAGADRHRIRRAADSVIPIANDRTTAISAALLAQAVQGRADPAIDRCLRVLLAPEGGDGAIADVIEDVREIGHTSGLDTLVGMLTALLLVAPDRDGSRQGRPR